jgi:hypothetical protein
MTEYIALYKQDDRDFLLKILSGEFEFEELMQMVEEKIEQTKRNYKKTAFA